MNWYISLYRNLPNDLKTDCTKKRGLYLVKKWTEHTTSICTFNIRNFIEIVFKNNIDW